MLIEVTTIKHELNKDDVQITYVQKLVIVNINLVWLLIFGRQLQIMYL